MLWTDIGPYFSIRVWFDWLRYQNPLLGLIMATGGLLFMFYGWRITRAAITLSSALLGALTATTLADNLEFGPAAEAGLVALCATLLAALGRRSVKIAAAILGGVLAQSACVYVATWLSLPAVVVSMSGTAVGLLVASLAFILFDHVVIFVTSLEGAVMLVSGMMIILAERPATMAALRDLSLNNPLFIPMTFVAPTVIAFCLQLSEYQEKDAARPAT